MFTEVQNNNGRITYSKLSIPGDGGIDDVALNLGFDDRSPTLSWYLYRFSHFSEHYQKLFADSQMLWYHPTTGGDDNRKGDGTSSSKGGSDDKVAQGICLNYVFVLANTHQVSKFLEDHKIAPVYQRISKSVLRPGIFVTVPRLQMHSFMAVCQGYVTDETYVTPDALTLSKGDYVCVTSGELSGVEGILIKDQGSHSGGRIFISIHNRVGVLTARIPDDNLQVLSFSRQNDHFYRTIEAIESILRQGLALVREHKPLTAELRASLMSFLYRYERLSGLTLVSRTKLTACRYAAHMLLGSEDRANEVLQAFLSFIETDKAAHRNWSRYPTASAYLTHWQQQVSEVLT